jgi:hypothetical protein
VFIQLTCNVHGQSCPTTLYQIYAGPSLDAATPCPAITFTTNGLLVVTTGLPVTEITDTAEQAYKDLVQLCRFYYTTLPFPVAFTLGSMTRVTTASIAGTWTREETWVGGYFAGGLAGVTPLFAYFPLTVIDRFPGQGISSTVVNSSYANLCIRPELITTTAGPVLTVTTTLPPITSTLTRTATSILSTTTIDTTTTFTLALQTRLKTVTSASRVSTVTVFSTLTTPVVTEIDLETRTRYTTVLLTVTSTSVLTDPVPSPTKTTTRYTTATINPGVTVSTSTTTTDYFCSDRVPIPPRQ